MTHKLRWLAVAGLMALLSAGAVACGTTTTEPQEPWNYCTYPGEDGSGPPTCEGENLVCDPHDGLCKCGDIGGPLCHEGETCVVEPGEAAYCVSDRCALVECTDGMSCDPADGECKCGGDVCDSGERCLDGACVSAGLCDDVVCAPSESCDPVDGFCKCNGEVCGAGSTCIDGSCESNPCVGVNCGPNLYCNPSDGLCHCGSEDGQLCATGAACIEAEEGFACEGVQRCEGVVCPSGTTCDPDDGLCHCGGIGPDSPVCSEDKMCNPETKTCDFGDQCDGVVCEDGLTCNPENGQCNCGGVYGVDCAEGERCVEVAGASLCAPPCDVLDQSTCGEGWGCFLGEGDASRGGFCAPLATTPRGKDQPCDSSTDCAAGLHCAEQYSPDNLCKEYCDTTVSSCSGSDICLPIGSSQSGVGFCFSL